VQLMVRFTQPTQGSSGIVVIIVAFVVRPVVVPIHAE
jgi:hypothetical protein